MFIATRPTLVVLADPVVAQEEMSIGARVPGLALEEVRVQVGDVVARGQVLATLDTALTEAQVLQAQGAVAAAEALCAQAASEATRAAKLVGTGAIAEQTYDQVRSKAAVLRAELIQTQAALKVAELKVTQARILAPDAGVISARSAIVGSVLSPGQELFRLIRRNQLEWRAEVTEAQATELAPGQSVRLLAADQGAVHGPKDSQEYGYQPISFPVCALARAMRDNPEKDARHLMSRLSEDELRSAGARERLNLKKPFRFIIQ